MPHAHGGNAHGGNAHGGNAAERAHEAIRSAIIDGDYPPGTMLSEATLAESLSMSRTPVRAALGRLQDQGLVAIYPKRGALVRELGQREVVESAQVRHALETAGVRLAEAGAWERLGPRLDASLDVQRRALASGDYPAFVVEAMAFHRTFVELSGNSVMLAEYDRMRDRQYLGIVRRAPSVRQDPERVIAEHRALLGHARGRDWVAFADHLARHQEFDDPPA